MIALWIYLAGLLPAFYLVGRYVWATVLEYDAYADRWDGSDWSIAVLLTALWPVSFIILGTVWAVEALAAPTAGVWPWLSRLVAPKSVRRREGP